MPGRPVYKHIEFVRDAETLWAKIESHWDWLGVHPDEKFVVGYPKRGRGITVRASPTAIQEGAEEGGHGVRVWVPLFPSPSNHWFTTEGKAKAHYCAEVELELDADGPGILRIERIEDGEVVEQEFVVRRHSTYR